MSATAPAVEPSKPAGGPSGAPPSQPSSATPAAVSTPTAPTGPFDGLPVEIRGAPSLAKFKGVEDLAKSYLELETKIGAKGLIVPGKDAPQSEIDAFQMALGRPEKPDGYAASKFTPPEGLPWNEGLLPALLPEAHKLGITDAQMTGLLSAYANAQNESFRAGVTQVEQQRQQGEQSLRREWGNAFDAKRDAARRALVAFAGNGKDAIASMTLSDGTALGDNPTILKLFAAIGDAMGEHPLLGDVNRRMTMTPEEATREIARFEAENKDALLNNMHPLHKDVMERRSALYRAKAGA